MGDKMKKIQSKLQKLRKYNSTFKNIRAKSQLKNNLTTGSKNINLQNNEDTKPQQPQKTQQNKAKVRSLPSLTQRKSKSFSLQKNKYKRVPSKVIEKKKEVIAKTHQFEEEKKEPQKVQNTRRKETKNFDKITPKKKKLQHSKQKQRNKQHENEQTKQRVKPSNKLKPNTFEIVTQKQENNTTYNFRGTFRLFNSRHPAQHLFIQQAFHISDLTKQKYHLILGLQSKIFSDDNFDDLQPYHQVVLNSTNIPQCLENSVKNSSQFFDYLYQHLRDIQLRVSNGKMDSITYLAIKNDVLQNTMCIPLYYGKDKITGGQKRIGYAQFDDNMAKRVFYDVLRSQQRRSSFYAKSLEISLQSKREKRDGFIFKKVVSCIVQMNVRTLRLTGDVSLGWEYQLKFSGLIILDLDDVESIEVLQNFEFQQLKCIIISGKNMLNLRSLRKLHINADAEMDLKLRCQQNAYPLRFAIERGLSKKQQYTFTNLSSLTEVPFSFSCTNSKCLNKVKYLNSNDTMVPMNLLAKLSDSSISNLKYSNYSDLNVAYTFAAKYLSIMKRDYSVLLDRYTDGDRI